MRAFALIVVLALILLVLLGAFFAGQFWANKDSLFSRGPTIAQIESLGQLTVLRVTVTDVIKDTGHGYQGSWQITGDGLLAVDFTKADLMQREESKKIVTIRLPPPQVLEARLDSERTKTWDFQKRNWIWPGNPDKLIDHAMKEAQRIVESRVQEPELIDQARENAERLLSNMYGLVGWDIRVAWSDREDHPKSAAPDNPLAASPNLERSGK